MLVIVLLSILFARKSGSFDLCALGATPPRWGVVRLYALVRHRFAVPERRCDP